MDIGFTASPQPVENYFQFAACSTHQTPRTTIRYSLWAAYSLVRQRRRDYADGADGS
jgi:hypothetical protein